MTAILELGNSVKARRTQIGLSQATLAQLSGLSRQTISELESGAIKDLSLGRAERLAGVLGLHLRVADGQALKGSQAGRMSPLGRAARTASVSYRKAIPPDRLRMVLLAGESAPADMPYVHAFLDEAPVSLLASVAEQLQDDAGGSAQVWQNYRSLARQLKSSRNLWK